MHEPPVRSAVPHFAAREQSEAVADLHRRLTKAGFPVEGPADEYGPWTSVALERFQRARGLEVRAGCDERTWTALVEASFQLGDRLLYLQRPLLRGDDVAELQRRLGALGFDAGRVDGIFGAQTERALVDFQRNAGLPTDAIAGPVTTAEMLRLGAMSAAGSAVAEVRERDLLRRGPRGVAGRTVIVGETGTAAVLADAVARHLRELGAVVVSVHHPEWSAHATTANATGASLYLGLAVGDGTGLDVAWYRSPGYESPGGRQLASLVRDRLTEVGLPVEAAGRRSPILRETRMTAVLCTFGSPAVLVRRTGAIAGGLARAVEEWALEPTPSPSTAG